MQRSIQFIDEWFWLLCGAVLLGGFIRLTWRFQARKRRAPLFPPRGSVIVRFHETSASGSSDKNFLSRIANTGSRLEITVTDNEVWVQPRPLVSLLDDEFDLEHRIPFGEISSAEIVHRLTRFLRLGFKLPDGSTRHLKLRLQDPEAFLTALTPTFP